MGLVFSGEQRKDLSNVTLEAFDAHTEKRVIIKVSTEAVEDYGLEKAREIAEKKYDRLDIGPDGFVRVTTADF